MRMIPAPKGTGCVAAMVAKKILNFAGIDNVYLYQLHWSVAGLTDADRPKEIGPKREPRSSWRLSSSER